MPRLVHLSLGVDMKSALILALCTGLVASPAFAEGDKGSWGGKSSKSGGTSNGPDGPNIGPFVPVQTTNSDHIYYEEKIYQPTTYVSKVKVVKTYKVKVVETHSYAKTYGYVKSYGHAAASEECDCVLSNLLGTHWQDGCQKMNFSYSEAARLRAFYGL